MYICVFSVPHLHVRYRLIDLPVIYNNSGSVQKKKVKDGLNFQPKMWFRHKSARNNYYANEESLECRCYNFLYIVFYLLNRIFRSYILGNRDRCIYVPYFSEAIFRIYSHR